MTVDGFSLELESAALTQLADLPVAALCLHSGRVVFSDGMSLYRIGGDTDAGAAIATHLTLPPVDAGGPSRLIGFCAYGVVGGRLELTARSESDCELAGTLGPGSDSGLPGRVAARFPRGFGRTWEVALAGDDGATLDIAALTLRTLPLDRRAS